MKILTWNLERHIKIKNERFAHTSQQPYFFGNPGNK